MLLKIEKKKVNKIKYIKKEENCSTYYLYKLNFIPSNFLYAKN